MPENEQDVLSQVLAELTALRVTVQQQQSIIDQLQANQTTSNPQPLTSNPTKATSRRKLLKGIAVAAAGVATTGTSIVSVNTASADATGTITGSSTNLLGLYSSPNGVARPNFTGTAGVIGVTDSNAPVIGYVTGVQGASNNGYGVYGVSASGRGVTGKSTTNAGVEGISDTNYGVIGSSISGEGVGGRSTDGIGVSGISTNSNGVQANSAASGGFGVVGSNSKGTGVGGFSTTSTGVKGQSFGVLGAGVEGISDNGWGGVFNGGKAPLYLLPPLNTTPGAPITGTYPRGVFYVSTENANLSNLYFCISSGTPGTWSKLSRTINGLTSDIIIQVNGVPITPNGQILNIVTPSVPTTTNTTFLATPIRVKLVLSSDGGALKADPSGNPTNNTIQDVQVTGVVDTVSGLSVPAGAKAIIGALTSVGATSSGNLRLWPSGGSVPNVNTLNIPAKPDGTGFNLTTSVTVGLSTSGKISVAFSGAAGAKCGFALDVAGYIL